MKLKFRILIGIFLCITMLFAFTACENTQPVGELTPEQVAFVRQSYFDNLNNREEYDLDDIKITNYLGTYHKNIVVILRALPEDVMVPEVIVTVYVDDIFITNLSNPSYILIVCTPKGEIYTLYEAYHGGLVLKKDLYKISEIAESRWKAKN